MKPFANNKAFYDYLLVLASVLKNRGSNELSGLTVAASRHAAGMSTEFLGESRIALRQVLAKENVLTDGERADLSEVLKQLDKSLDERNP
jgi:hypothetical protein